MIRSRYRELDGWCRAHQTLDGLRRQGVGAGRKIDREPPIRGRQQPRDLAASHVRDDEGGSGDRPGRALSGRRGRGLDGARRPGQCMSGSAVPRTGVGRRASEHRQHEREEWQKASHASVTRAMGREFRRIVLLLRPT